MNASLGSPEAERGNSISPQPLLHTEPEPEPEPELDPESDMRLPNAEDGGHTGAGAMERMDYPAGFASTARRPGMAPGMDAYLAAGQLAVPRQPPGQANNDPRDGGGDAMPSSSVKQMTGSTNNTFSSPLPRGAEGTLHLQGSQQEALRVSQSGQEAHLKPGLLTKPDDPHHLLGAKKALFRAVVQDNASLVSNLIAQHPELLT
eukprot:COSAG02_NODE_25936_length_645_cov_0.871795_1_plen_204_part_00